jgi:hypothetical protein
MTFLSETPGGARRDVRTRAKLVEQHKDVRCLTRLNARCRGFAGEQLVRAEQPELRFFRRVKLLNDER